MEHPAHRDRLTVLAAALPVGAAVAAGVYAESLLQSAGGAILLAALAGLLIIALIVLDIPAAVDAVEGNTFSELLRAGGRQLAVFPWTFGVFAGRWFHPLDGLDLFGVDGAVALLAISFVVVAGTHFIRLHAWFLPSWIVVALGLVSGSILWPLG